MLDALVLGLEASSWTTQTKGLSRTNDGLFAFFALDGSSVGSVTFDMYSDEQLKPANMKGPPNCFVSKPQRPQQK